MKKNNFIFKALLLSSIIFFASCSSDDEPKLPKGDYENGILISGEGSGAGSGSITFISNDLESSESKIFNKVNNTELGTYLQSMAFDESRAYIIVDNQNVVTVVNRFTFEKIGQITDQLSGPRYMTIVGDKGYVTNWGVAGAFLAVVDLTSYTVEDEIALSAGPERVVYNNGNLYISHKGGFGTNNLISVVEISSKSVEEVIVKDNPDELIINDSGNLVVLSEGRTIYDGNWNVTGHTLAAISIINPNTLTIDRELLFPEEKHPSLMVLNNNTIYYALDGKVFSITEDATSLSTTSILESQGYLYGLEVAGNRIYTLDADFSDVSELHVFNLGDHQKIKTMEAPIGASKIYFN